jgi:hypothetical protein
MLWVKRPAVTLLNALESHLKYAIVLIHHHVTARVIVGVLFIPGWTSSKISAAFRQTLGLLHQCMEMHVNSRVRHQDFRLCSARALTNNIRQKTKLQKLAKTEGFWVSQFCPQTIRFLSMTVHKPRSVLSDSNAGRDWEFLSAKKLNKNWACFGLANLLRFLGVLCSQKLIPILANLARAERHPGHQHILPINKARCKVQVL